MIHIKEPAATITQLTKRYHSFLAPVPWSEWQKDFGSGSWRRARHVQHERVMPTNFQLLAGEVQVAYAEDAQSSPLLLDEEKGEATYDIELHEAEYCRRTPFSKKPGEHLLRTWELRSTTRFYRPPAFSPQALSPEIQAPTHIVTDALPSTQLTLMHKNTAWYVYEDAMFSQRYNVHTQLGRALLYSLAAVSEALLLEPNT